MDKVQAVIDRLEAQPKQGESYDAKGRHGWRNPIRQDTGALLEALVIAHSPKSILEIGTAHGLSGCYLARRLPSEGRMVSIEWDEATAKEAQENFREAGLPVSVKHGDAMQIIPTLCDKADMVFMDANKDGYLEQIQKLIELGILVPDCLVVADNVIDRKSECQNFLDFMAQYNPVVIPTETGLLVGRI